MKKMSGTLMAFVLCTLLAQAQKHEPVNRHKDQMLFNGYTIRLLPAMGCTYGYDIVKENQILLHQMHNPFTASRMGLSRKEDVYKVAQWQIENVRQLPAAQDMGQTQNKGHLANRPSVFRRRCEDMQTQQTAIIPAANRKVAEQLHIDVDNH